MQLSEKEIEDFIFSDLYECDGNDLHNQGMRLRIPELILSGTLTNNVKWFRQINLGPYGILDVVGVTRFKGKVLIDLIELKSVPMKPDDFNQIFRYKQGIIKMLPNRFDFSFRMYLVGPSLQEGHYIHNECDISVLTYKYDLSGIRFTDHGKNADWYELSGDPSKLNILKHLRNG